MAELLRVDTEVSCVTFFEDRAEVTRIAKVSVPAGRSRVQARGITLLVDDRSLVCKTKDAAQIVFSRVRRTVEEVAAASASEVHALEAELVAARERLSRADRMLATVKTNGDRTGAMMQLWTESVASVPSRGSPRIEKLGSCACSFCPQSKQGLMITSRPTTLCT